MDVSEHLPLQSVILTPSSAFTPQPHVPFVQLWVMEQTVPHLPQLNRSVFRFVHMPSHVTYPGLQAQVPFRQVLPIPLQLAPQEPQLKSSSCRSTQEKLQFVCPERQPLDTLSFELETDSLPSSYLILVL
jgi:hypothetical protein